jgi:hypothetical protein
MKSNMQGVPKKCPGFLMLIELKPTKIAYD